MEYRIVRDDDADNLEIKVLSYIREGWKPLGGVSVALGIGYLWYAQAMVKGD
jgi:hypothetical protein